MRLHADHSADQAAISDYAGEQGSARRQVEADMKEAAHHPRPTI
ncbi:hypothetical protein [Streptomyces massasporeus]